ncbi:SGNH hydrolase [Emericellopsis cladophorae]|uniref:SGNH hydrolase n=1 Tax=Emericellopsis cladophorae TaxID=2686198 RepID=A0A9P9XYL2_9HYPO|nr:SGNH hydrolase [Emericellopsis cladophorae]KAI6779850.1 SGNH hydrolase [Emericellopsis cladophorae]
MLKQTIVGLLGLSHVAAAWAVPSPHAGLHREATVTAQGIRKRDSDVSEFSWVKRWAAIGDSYTAGIGAGAPLGRIWDDELEITLPDGTISGHGDWYCSRYNRAYPKVIEKQFGSHIEDFQFLACSGDRSEQIFQQVEHLEGDLDFVTLTAGGNDLCLAKMIKDCIMLPYLKDDACDTVIEKAQENIDTILKDNVRQILTELNGKMSKDGIVVINGYAQFFNVETDDCADQSWDAFWMIPLRKLSFESLTKSRRERFNKLVIGINEAIGEVVDEVAEDKDIGYKIGFAQWDLWAKEGVDGQMCSPSSNGNYPDQAQPDMQFIKPDTHPWRLWTDDVKDELRRRDAKTLDDLTPEERRTFLRWEADVRRRAAVFEDSIYESVLYKSSAPGAEVVHQLDKRAPAPPGCPGDDGTDVTFGLGMPDSVGRNFHPNVNGHVSIASFVLSEAMDLRAVVLGEEPYCAVKSKRTCWSSKKDFRGYVQADRLDISYEDFCRKHVPKEHPDHTTNWEVKKTYDKGTPDEHQLIITLGNGLADFDEDKCLESFESLIHDCDTDNAMNWKRGGEYVVDGGDYTFEIYPKRDNRPWPPPSKPVGRCEGWWKVLFSHYEIEGGGFSTHDHGQKTMLPNMDTCYGLGTSLWKFKYYDEPTDEGYEWKATFNTPVFVMNRCFRNNKIVKAAGGWTDGCRGNDG